MSAPAENPKPLDLTKDTRHPAQLTKRGLPIEGATWTMDHDAVFFRRYRKLLAQVPSRALQRMAPYLGEIMSAAIWADDRGIKEAAQQVMPYPTAPPPMGVNGR